jgi:cytochrome c556
MFRVQRNGRPLVTIGLTAIIVAVGATSPAATPAQIIKSRKEGLKAIGDAMKTIKDQLIADKPDAGAIKAAGAKVSSASSNFDTWFPKGTGPETGVETDAKPEIWAHPEDFTEKTRAFQAETAKLVAMTDAGKLNGLRDEARKVGKTCAACHNSYRVKKED